MHLFNKYYVFIIFHTSVMMISLFYFVRKYVDEKYYILFFFLFMCTTGMMFNMISALRSTLAACIIWWGLELFYLRRKNILLYILFVFSASLVHTSAIVFALMPLFDLFFRQIKWQFIFIIVCVFLVLNMFYTNIFMDYITTSIGVFNDYNDYVYKSTTSVSNFNGIIFKSLYLFPTFYIIKFFKYQKGAYYYITMLALIFILIHMIGLNFEGRFTAYLFLFFIISLSETLKFKLKMLDRFIIIIPMIFITLFTLYNMYDSMFLNRFGSYYNGNYLFYQTIFSVPQLP